MLKKLLVGLVLIAAVVGGGWYFFNQGKQEFSLRPGEKLSDEQVSALITRVGRFLILPAGEKPSVAAISDAATLASRQSFYQDAKDGDILLVYTSKAIIYDAAADKLVNVGPIVRTDQPVAPVASGSLPAQAGAQASPSVSPSGTPEPAKPVTIEVRNGTSTAGLAGALASQLKKNALFTVETVGDATGSYTEVVVVDLTKGSKTSTVAALKAELEKSYTKVTVVSELPKGERATTKEVLVLIGK